MTLHIEYITDTKGKPKSVVIPNGEWLKFNRHYELLKNKLAVLTGIESAFKDLKDIKSGKKKAKSLAEFLDEL